MTAALPPQDLVAPDSPTRDAWLLVLSRMLASDMDLRELGRYERFVKKEFLRAFPSKIHFVTLGGCSSLVQRLLRTVPERELRDKLDVSQHLTKTRWMIRDLPPL